MTLPAASTVSVRRLGIRVRGQVQGVGFRPHVVRLAQSLHLSGWVSNDGEGVLIEVQGLLPEMLVQALRQTLPALARIDAIEVTDLALRDAEQGFTVKDSVPGQNSTLLPADTSICGDCLAELFDPHSRYYRYPFLNCSHCGPRYTVVQQLPYDRPHTSLCDFPMCPACDAEYHDVSNRRFHAQPTACVQCGPVLSHPIEDILARIRAGEIVALKGLGGFHLLCDATNTEAVERLRQRKQREAKPFAIMVANGASADGLVQVDAAALSLLTSRQSPIVLLPKKPVTSVPLAAGVAPGLNQLGVMLPSTPLHYLLFHEAAGRPSGRAWLQQPQALALVMTSANANGEPLVIGNDEARQRLGTIADTLVTHNRDIVTPVDDSVVQVIHGAPQFIRRARGYVPEAITLAKEVPPILAVGAHLKNTVCVTRGREAFVSQHVGSLDNPATVAFFTQTIERLCEFLQVTPEIVAHDLHPDFFSTRYAHASGLHTEAVQHHHAHVAAVMAEHHLEEPALGLVLDGYGLGDDGSAWGGELLHLHGAAYTRLGHLQALPQPGGERAAREPWRMAAAVLHGLGKSQLIRERFAEQPLAPQVADLLEQDQFCPSSSSAGRLFDAVSALLGVCSHNRYEGQAAMLLQHQVTRPRVLPASWKIDDEGLDLSPLLSSLLDMNKVEGANVFHGTLIAALCDWVMEQVEAQQLSTVVLGGGCFLNAILLRGVTAQLQDQGVRVLSARRLPVNDGGVCLGQAWIAARRQHH